MIGATIDCLICHQPLIDPGTPLTNLNPTLVAELIRIHDANDHTEREWWAYDAIAVAVATIQAQHETT